MILTGIAHSHSLQQHTSLQHTARPLLDKLGLNNQPYNLRPTNLKLPGNIEYSPFGGTFGNTQIRDS